MTKSIAYNDHKVDVLLFTGSESFKLLHTLQEKVIPSMSGLLSGLDLSSGLSLDKAKIDLSAIQKSINSFFELIGGPDEAFSLLQKILSNTVIYSKKSEKEKRIYDLADSSAFDEFFTGKIEESYGLAWEVIKINYPFFLRNIPDLSRLMSKINMFAASAPSRSEEVKNSGASEDSHETSKKTTQSTGSRVADFMAESGTSRD